MSVKKYRIKKKLGGFTTFPNKVLQNLKNLEALGLYCYLHSLPSDWEFYKTQLRMHANIGIHKLDSLLKILEKHHLIKMVQVRDEKGRFAHIDLEVDDGNSFVINDLEIKSEPCTENRNTVSRITEISNYKRSKKQSKQNTKEVFKSNSATDVAREHKEDKFFNFWKAYPIKKNKVRAQKIWQRKRLDVIADKIIQDVVNRRSIDSQWREEQFIPHPSTYLTNELW